MALTNGQLEIAGLGRKAKRNTCLAPACAMLVDTRSPTKPHGMHAIFPESGPTLPKPPDVGRVWANSGTNSTRFGPISIHVGQIWLASKFESRMVDFDLALTTLGQTWPGLAGIGQISAKSAKLRRNFTEFGPSSANLGPHRRSVCQVRSASPTNVCVCVASVPWRQAAAIHSCASYGPSISDGLGPGRPAAAEEAPKPSGLHPSCVPTPKRHDFELGDTCQT